MTEPSAAATNRAAMRRILHNLADHTEVLARLFARGGLPQGFQRRLLDHVGFEEAENERRLQGLAGAAGVPAHELETLIQHSRLIAELAANAEPIDGDLVGELLHHFGEEHGWIAEALEAPPVGQAPAPGAAAGRPTVGSLIGE